MTLTLIAAFASAVCYGVASVLQAVAARRIAHNAARGGQVGPRLLLRVVGQGPFLIGIALDVAGFACQFFALRSLPLYLVQAVVAASLAVTAMIAIPLLGLRHGALPWIAIAAVCAGLAMLAVSAGGEASATVHLGLRFALVALAVVLALVGLLAGMASPRWRGPLLGITAGLGFAVAALAARCTPDLDPASLLANPASYAVVLAGLVAYLCLATGLQQASVVTVTAAVVVAETAVPAIVGVVLLGDGARPGLVPLAMTGFLLAVAGALALAEFGGVGTSERPV